MGESMDRFSYCIFLVLLSSLIDTIFIVFLITLYKIKPIYLSLVPRRYSVTLIFFYPYLIIVNEEKPNYEDLKHENELLKSKLEKIEQSRKKKITLAKWIGKKSA